jgi:hypothetical protein
MLAAWYKFEMLPLLRVFPNASTALDAAQASHSQPQRLQSSQPPFVYYIIKHDRQSTYNVNTEARSRNQFYRQKAIIIT